MQTRAAAGLVALLLSSLSFLALLAAGALKDASLDERIEKDLQALAEGQATEPMPIEQVTGYQKQAEELYRKAKKASDVTPAPTLPTLEWDICPDNSYVCCASICVPRNDGNVYNPPRYTCCPSQTPYNCGRSCNSKPTCVDPANSCTEMCGSKCLAESHSCCDPETEKSCNRFWVDGSDQCCGKHCPALAGPWGKKMQCCNPINGHYCYPEHTCCGMTCAVEGQKCCEGYYPCSKDAKCCGNGMCGKQCCTPQTAHLCPKGEVCCGTRCAKNCCNATTGHACAEDEHCCGMRCLPKDQPCCNVETGLVCEENQQCCGGNCVSKMATCCNAESGLSCPPNKKCCGDKCIPNANKCCNPETGQSCPQNQKCCGDQCIPSSAVCCNGDTAHSCRRNQKCCGTSCAAKKQVCCNPETSLICPKGKCDQDQKVCLLESKVKNPKPKKG